MPRRPLLPLLALTALSVTACGGASAGDDGPSGSDAPLSVTVGFYPYEFVAERVGGPDVQVTNLTKAGAEPHDLELTPQQVGALAETDLVVYSKGFQPAVDEAVEQQASDRSFDVLEAVELREGKHEPHAEEEDEAHAGEESADPHVWLDPVRLATIAGAVADQLGELAPDRAEDFEQRAAELTAELKALDSELREGLSQCERTEIVTSHDAFGYLADAYGLDQVALTGLSPDDEASPKRLAEVTRFAKEHGVTTIFFEELVSPKVAESLAREVGAEAKELSPLEGPPETGDYMTAMQENLASLRAALDCA
jgi:zinc transport system substrate-binding protein